MGRACPTARSATVDDGKGPYQEMFAPGAFRRAVNGTHKVLLDFEHETEDRSTSSATASSSSSATTGCMARSRRSTGEPGKQALAIVRDGVLTGLSVRAFVMGPGRREGDVLVRTACHLDSVALCREPAYAVAVVEALRRPADATGAG